jgi:signal transduction histidine kinase
MGGRSGPERKPRPRRQPADWRIELVEPALTVLVVAFALLMAMAIPLLPGPRFRAPFFAFLACTFLIALLRIARGLPVEVRAWGAALATLAAAMVAVAHLGFGPALTIGLALIGAMLSVTLGRRAALVYFALATASLALLADLAVEGVLPLRLSAQDPADLTNWIRWIGSFAVFATGLALVVDTVVRRVEGSAHAQLVADQEHRRVTEALLALARDPSVESGRVDAAFAAITEAAARGLDVARAGVWLLADGGTRLRCVDMYHRVEARHEPGPSLAIEDHQATFAALGGGRVVTPAEAAAGPGTAELSGDDFAPRRATSLLLAPIRFRDQVTGAVFHEQDSANHTWSAEARSTAASLADFAARALAAAERVQKEEQLHEAYELLGRLHRRVESAKEDERRHLARDLHDELGQTLTALKLRLQMASKAPAAGAMPAAVDLVDRLIGRVRQLSIDLSPPLLDEVGLAPAIRAHLERGETPAGMRIDLDTAGLDERLPAEVETAAFRVVQESLTNIVRHAAASRVEISVRREDHLLHLRVRDDGRGFDVAETRRAAARGAHIGVVGMTERVKGLGGMLEVRSQPGQGTEVRATLPVTPPR